MARIQQSFHTSLPAFSHLPQSQKLGAPGDADLTDDEDLAEDGVLLESPLDRLNAYSMFREAMLSRSKPGTWRRREAEAWTDNGEPIVLQQDQPQLYSSMMAVLSPEQSNVVQAVLRQAEEDLAAAQRRVTDAALDDVPPEMAVPNRLS